MNTLIENVLQWGKDKGITGPNGRGTTIGQVNKMLEEANETSDAVYDREDRLESNDPDGAADYVADIKDGIGDTAVTLILLAEMHGWTLEECLQAAYDEIKGRTGVMTDGVFVKDSPSIDDDLGELDPSAACKLGDETCESCQ